MLTAGDHGRAGGASGRGWWSSCGTNEYSLYANSHACSTDQYAVPTDGHATTTGRNARIHGNSPSSDVHATTADKHATPDSNPVSIHEHANSNLPADTNTGTNANDYARRDACQPNCICSSWFFTLLGPHKR
ncbi:unnamed protein product [marine sediment metagenome]|uniref:Uncharacterized protein n=1 Tax=marine sediment metagenome TaxID=412755 RepID=X0XLI1_9ZZZZ